MIFNNILKKSTANWIFKLSNEKQANFTLGNFLFLISEGNIYFTTQNIPPRFIVFFLHMKAKTIRNIGVLGLFRWGGGIWDRFSRIFNNLPEFSHMKKHIISNVFGNYMIVLIETWPKRDIWFGLPQSISIIFLILS